MPVEGAEGKRMEGIPYERVMGEEKEREGEKESERKEYLEVVTYVAMELSATNWRARRARRVSRCGADLEGVNWSRGEIVLLWGEESGDGAISRAARTTPWIRRGLFLHVHTRFMLLAPLPRPSPATPLSRRPFYFVGRSTWTTREVETHRWYLPSHLRQTVPASLCFSLCLSLFFSPHLFCAVSSLRRNLARLRSVVLHDIRARQIAINDNINRCQNRENWSHTNFNATISTGCG